MGSRGPFKSFLNKDQIIGAVPANHRRKALRHRIPTRATTRDSVLNLAVTGREYLEATPDEHLVNACAPGIVPQTKVSATKLA
jgi:hypothetical protein